MHDLEAEIPAAQVPPWGMTGATLMYSGTFSTQHSSRLNSECFLPSIQGLLWTFLGSAFPASRQTKSLTFPG